MDANLRSGSSLHKGRVENYVSGWKNQTIEAVAGTGT